MIIVRVLQIKDESPCNYAFRDFTFAKEHNFDITDYRQVYRGQFTFTDGMPTDLEICENMFEVFNNSDAAYRKSVNFTGVSISVSDIVVVDHCDGTEPAFYYCDDLGWTNISKFVK